MDHYTIAMLYIPIQDGACLRSVQVEIVSVPAGEDSRDRALKVAKRRLPESSALTAFDIKGLKLDIIA